MIEFNKKTLIKWRRKLVRFSCIPLYYIFRIFPLQNKVVATTFRGRKFGDNPQYICEELYKLSKNIDFVWLKNSKYNYDLPSYIRPVSFFSHWKKAYEYATAKVWLNTHRMEWNIRKRKNQLFIETWYGGLGIKKIEGDFASTLECKSSIAEINNTSEMADLFISNSDHLTKIYRRAFAYKGKIWKSGYPKNDSLFVDPLPIQKKVKEYFHLDSKSKIFFYAPTFRDSLEQEGIFEKEPYEIDFSRVKSILNEVFGGDWSILVRWHPVMLKNVGSVKEFYGSNIIDASYYPDIQELILACDGMLSDYSSCIFDAAMLQKPCFLYATDFEQYVGNRGVYYTLNELPFPCAKNQKELETILREFNVDSYSEQWKAFSLKTGLHETGHAAKDIAEVIHKFIQGDFSVLESIKNEL